MGKNKTKKNYTHTQTHILHLQTGFKTQNIEKAIMFNFPKGLNKPTIYSHCLGLLGYCITKPSHSSEVHSNLCRDDQIHIPNEDLSRTSPHRLSYQ